jgi:hypothetical protein
VFESIYPLNIALAETVKLENENLHQVSLICEPTSNEQVVETHIAKLREKLSEWGYKFEITKLPPLPDLEWNRTGEVEHGWVKRVKWAEAIAQNYASIADEVDFTRVVVSADTETRVLRYVFPRQGAVTLSIRHADEPGALATIATAIKTCSFNILSAFLRRGGGNGLDAELVAVCEPERKFRSDELFDLKRTLSREILAIPQKFRPQLTVSNGRDAEEAIYCRHPEEVVARVPENLSWPVQQLKTKWAAAGDKKTKIFISRRFPQSEDLSRLVADVRETLGENDCLPVEAESTMGRDLNTIYVDVSSKMWAVKAGIVLVINVPDKKIISINTAHELGFLLGQGKNVLVLVEDDEECRKEMSTFSNLAGVVFQTFDPKISRGNIRSMQWIITEWIKVVNAK